MAGYQQADTEFILTGSVGDNPDINKVVASDRELRDCRQQNREILDKMSKMEAMIEDLMSSDKQQRIKIEDLASTDEQQGIMIEDNIQRLDTLSTRGRWCGYKYEWSTDNSIITYDSYFFTDTNMNVSGTPLDINSGIKLTNNCITHLLTFVSL